MSKLIAILKKNIQLLMQKRTSLLVILLLPILIVLLIGFAFSNTNPASVNVGVYAPSGSEDINALLNSINESRFIIQDMDSEEVCQQKVKLGEKHLCIVVDDSLDVTTQQKTVQFYVDYTEVNLVHDIINSMNVAVDTRSQEITKSFTQDILADIDTAKNGLSDAKETLQTLRSSLETTIDNLNPLKSSIQTLENNLTSNTIDTQTLSNIILDLKISLDDRIDELNETSGHIDNKLNELDGYTNSSSDSLREELDDLIIDLTNISQELNGTNSSLKNRFDDYNSQIREQTSSQNNKIDEAKESLASVRSSINDIQTNLQDKQEQLNSVIGTITASINALEESRGEDANLISQPLKTEVTSITSRQSHFNIIFAGLVVVVLMMTSLLLSSSLVLDEKFSRAYFRNMISPVNPFLFSIGMYITSLFIMFVQLSIFFGISRLLFSTTFATASAFNIILVMFLGASFFIILGMCIAYLFNSEASINLAITFITAIFIFFSDLILPIENMAPLFQRMATISPFMLIKELLQGVMFFDTPLLLMGPELFQLALYVIEIMIILVITVLVHNLKIWSYFHGSSKPSTKTKRPMKKKHINYKNPYA